MCRRWLPIPLAPTSEQRRIVAKIEELLSDLDAGVSALRRAETNLKRYRAAVLKNAVEGKLTESWRNNHPNSETAAKLLERILTERRQKWEAAQLEAFVALVALLLGVGRYRADRRRLGPVRRAHHGL